MKIVIVGAGSLGLLLAGKLAAVPDAEVSLITRSKEQAARISFSGLQLEEGGQTLFIANVGAVPSEDAVKRTPHADWMLLTTKQTHWSDALIQLLSRGLERGGKLVLFQNGVGHLERLQEAGVPLDQVYVAVTTEGARKDADHAVAHTGIGMTSLGGAHAGASSAPLEAFGRMLQQAGLQSEIVPDIEQYVWRKLLINSVINPLTAILRIRNGELLQSPHYVKMMRALLEEGVAAVQQFQEDEKEQIWEQLLSVCEKTSENSSSMLQDILAERETEIESINGAIVRLAAERRMAVPTHEAVYHMVKGIQAKIIERG